MASNKSSPAQNIRQRSRKDAAELKLDNHSKNSKKFTTDTNLPKTTNIHKPKKHGYNKLIIHSLCALLIISRCISGLFAPIQDCDEVYNYWEPFHFLLFGYGKQTWEFSSQFALRSWFPLKIYQTLAVFLQSFLGFSSKADIFYAIRVSISLFSAVCEITFVNAIKNYIDEDIAAITLFNLIFGAGMYHASSSFLPSTLSLQLFTLSYSYGIIPPPSRSFWTQYKNSTLCLTFASAATVWGWPYTGILVFPWIIEQFLVKGTSNNSSQKMINIKSNTQINWRISRLVSLTVSSISAVVISTIPPLLVDYYYYKKLTFPTLNQILYNVFPVYFDPIVASKLGPELYGTEPWYYYMLNGFINWNFIFLSALLSIPLLVFYNILSVVYQNSSASIFKKNRNFFFLRMLPLAVLFLILTAQPHKEERFLYPIYPLVCLGSAISLKILESIYKLALNPKKTQTGYNHQNFYFKIFLTGFLLFSALLGVSRILAINRNYSSATDIYTFLPQQNQKRIEFLGYEKYNMFSFGTKLKNTFNNFSGNLKNQQNLHISKYAKKNNKICLGKDWYRFPSHFHTPAEYQLTFIKSKFNGLLPGDFIQALEYSSIRESSSAYINNTNCLNQYEPINVLAENITQKCDFLVDVSFNLENSADTQSSNQMDDIEPDYSLQVSNYKTIKCLPFLNSQNSPIWVRGFYFGKTATKVLNKIYKKNSNDNWGKICILESLLSNES
ncbi:hypothetical protein BB561_003869 [Smittium simulii]|uniref:Mannosyltransferase n=1 Tax=Smittium simulii TaxID=133385 RepID=A0A2T9YJ54_9FUNG|nr:hypothetical protein BB561_003869 [Smittium simulii]